MNGGDGPTTTGDVQPRRAPVVPRARRLPGGEPLPIERLVRTLLGHGRRGAVRLLGPPGSGKTSALQHLAACFTVPRPVRLLDDAPLGDVAALAVSSGEPVLFASPTDPPFPLAATLEIEPWGDDDLIEYLLNADPGRVGSVMQRVRGDTDRAALRGSPLLWRIVLERMAASEQITTSAAALRSFLAVALPDPIARRRVSAAALRACTGGTPTPDFSVDYFAAPNDRIGLCALKHRVVHVLLAAERVAVELVERRGSDSLSIRFPVDLLRETATVISSQTEAHDRLSEILSRRSDPFAHPTAASLLLAIDPNWRPTGPRVRMIGAHLPAARWAGISLAEAKLDLANLSRADFSNAHLTGSSFQEAMLAGVNLRGASISNTHFNDADLSRATLADATGTGVSLRGAKLTGADLCGAKLRGATLTAADLSGASLRGGDLTDAMLHDTHVRGADFSDATLDGARLRRVCLSGAKFQGATFLGARLLQCVLEGMELTEPVFECASLAGSYLTGSVMPGANFRGANLASTGLAEIEWEGADLRDADFTDASFHMGSSRSGLVGSTIACEGSRTGFYTDDFNEQDYKSPEEIRKANLCGADLHGAKVDGVDFYLVDLRGARYTPQQGEHFKRCGAILRSRVS